MNEKTPPFPESSVELSLLGPKLERTLRGHSSFINQLSWSPDGRYLASASDDGTVKVWDPLNGEGWVRNLGPHLGGAGGAAFSPTGQGLVSVSRDGQIRFWRTDGNWSARTVDTELNRERANRFYPSTVSFHPSGERFAVSGTPGVIRDLDGAGIWRIRARSNVVVFDPTGKLVAADDGKTGISVWRNHGRSLTCRIDSGFAIYGLAFDPTGGLLASGGSDGVVRVWDPLTGRLLNALEGHTNAVDWVEFSPDGQLLVSKSNDDTVNFWSRTTWATIATLEVAKNHDRPIPGLAFHPSLQRVAIVASDLDHPKGRFDQVVQIWKLESGLLELQLAAPSRRYVNAKVVLVGDTGVGKSGLGLVLTDQPFEATDSTPGRRVWMLDTQEVDLGNGVTQVRETLLWDLAGQPGYRIIHQLHLNEVAVALVVFDARSEIDPLAGVRHWERALRLAKQRQGAAGVPSASYLVSARNDRGGVAIGEERIQALLDEFGFQRYFRTSAKEGWQIDELQNAIRSSIPWDALPEVSSSQLFARIKSFLLQVKSSGRLLAPVDDLLGEFELSESKIGAKDPNLREKFRTCVGRLENRDLIRCLTFGNYVLLQPELLDAYASAMVNAAREEPDGLGSLAEESALQGKFYVPGEQRISDRGQEQLLLYATVEELVRHDLALRESADDGRYLVFPSQFNRDYEDAPEPRGKTSAITFDGPVQSLYSTLAVRLGHSGIFATGRAEMWRNAAVFSAKAGGRCGVFLQEFAEGRGRLTLFFDEKASAETRFHFEEYVLAHTRSRAIDGSVEIIHFFVCHGCGDPVPDNYVKRLRERGDSSFACPCGTSVPIVTPGERLTFPSEVAAMDRSADRERDLDAFLVSAKGETTTERFTVWAGGRHVTLAIVFTDIVGSTALNEEIGDEAMARVRRAHFARTRALIQRHSGREVKTIGDSVMAAFRSAQAAVDFAVDLQADTGSPRVRIRAGVHIGPLEVDGEDVFGGTVNFAARVLHEIRGPELWISQRAKEDLDRGGFQRHRNFNWLRHDNLKLKGFSGSATLWALQQNT